MHPKDVAASMLRFLDRMRYCESLMFVPGLGTSRHPHKHPHNFCPNLPNSGVSEGIQAWSPLSAKQFNRSDRNELRDTRERRRTPLTGGIGVLITQRSKVQILPPQPTKSTGYADLRAYHKLPLTPNNSFRLRLADVLL